MTDRQPSAERITGGLFAALLFAFGLSVFMTCCSVWKLGRMALSRLALVLPALLLAAPLAAQEAENPQPEHSPIAASAWCAVHEDGREEGEPGCDAGIGGALHCWGRACLVGVLGMETLGPGASWRLHVDEEGRVYAVALGVVAPWDEDGVRVSDWAVAVGATLSFRGSER